MSSTLFESASEARYGSLGVPPAIPIPSLPNIVAEWAAIIPLVTHLASPRDDYITTGDITLSGSLSIELFPRLGILSSYSRLLTRGTKFLDYASTRGGSSRMVYDVSWGSVFPCANGAASSAVIRYLLSRSKSHSTPTVMPEKRPCPQKFEKETGKSCSFSTQSSTVTTDIPTQASPGMQFCSPKQSQNNRAAKSEELPDMVEKHRRRFQTLHVIRFYRKPKRLSTFQALLLRQQKATWYQAVCFVVLTGLAVFLGVVGAYGTAAVLICCAVSKLVAWRVPILRPALYLENNESSLNDGTYMLVASHQNASEWILLIGDRAVVDTLLNKPMIAVIGDGAGSPITHFAAIWFRFAHILQLTGMTFVAAQKGWDGISLVVLMAVHWALHAVFSRSNLVRTWLQEEGIGADVKSFGFRGRMPMLGAIQIFSGAKTTRWMDDIAVPHPRRDAWLRCIQGDETWRDKEGLLLSQSDRQFVELSAEASIIAAAVLKHDFNGPRTSAADV
ncbi:hypothetical protein F5Y19DRAFT_440053 [Xylariaceae sp. FL1651]|nr:hypothetical protein F5Y19DRAFT_440053 [Xylariaceae sp. FL1651]